MKPSHDDLLKALLTARPGPETCPDANLLVGWAESRLDDARRVRVDEHLAACDACREEALLLRGELGSVTAPTSQGRRWSLRLLRLPIAIAAAALLAVGVALWAQARQGVPTSADPEATLLAWAADLRQREPELFEGLAPVASNTLPEVASGAQRGGIALEGLPRVFLGDDRPTFRWQAAPGAERYEVRVLDARGAPLWSEQASLNALPFPKFQHPLAPGAKYVLEVRAQAALGQVEGRRGFSVASDAEALRFRRADVFARGADATRADFVLTHLALARGFTLEAERTAAAHLARHPHDAGAKRLLAHVRTLLGRS